MLAERYATRRLNNPRHPISDLVFIILSARTDGTKHEAAYRRLRRKFHSWAAVRDARLVHIEREIRDAGLGRLKARQIKSLLEKITADFGSLAGSALRRMDDATLERYLTTLPGVGLKTARCVMLYTLDRRVFPVDTHCMRLFANLGIIGGRMRYERAQDALQRLVPADLRYSLHVNAVAHGRETCVPAAPRCQECPIESLCASTARGARYGSRRA